MKLNNKKILLSFLFILFIPLRSLATDIVIDGIGYNVDLDNLTLSVSSSFWERKEKFIIPDEVEYSSKTLKVVKIEKEAFRNDEIVKEIIIGNNVIEIGDNAFYGCNNLQSVKLGESVQYIGEGCFYNCNLLKSISIPRSVKVIKTGAFSCKGLTKVIIDDLASWCNIEFGGNDNSNPLFYAHTLYLGNQEIEDLVIPETVREIKTLAFRCANIKSVKIEGTVTKIGDSAFEDCTSLQSIELNPTLSSIGNSSFRNCSNLTSIVIPKTVNSIEEGAFSGCASLESIDLNNSIEYLASSLFSGCTKLKRIQITSPISYIGAHAFSYCSKLSEINIPGSTNYIGSDCFEGCFNLNKIIFEDAKDPIVFKPTSYSGFNPHFEDCPLTEVYLGRPLKNEDNISPFRYNKIKILTFNQNVESIGLFYIENWGGQIILNCLKSNPPYVNEFTKDQYMSAIVNIPKGSLNNYKNNSKWSSFWTFNEVYEFKAEDIILDSEKIRLYLNESFQITFTIVPEETTDKTIVWTSSDDKIATVSSNGLVTGVSLGKATITATCGEVSATCEVTVTEKDSGIEDVIIDSDSLLSVYSLQGFLIKDKCTADDLRELPKGVYIIVTSNKRYKIRI